MSAQVPALLRLLKARGIEATVDPTADPDVEDDSIVVAPSPALKAARTVETVTLEEHLHVGGIEIQVPPLGIGYGPRLNVLIMHNESNELESLLHVQCSEEVDAIVEKLAALLGTGLRG